MGGRAWCWMIAVWLSCAVGCGGGGVPVQNPTTLGAAGNVEMTEQAILEALPKRGWAAESVQPGRIVAFLSVRAHLLRVEIRYDPQQVNIYYVDSDNLAARVEGNVVYAHPKVNMWIRNLAQDISAALAVAPGGAPSAGGVAPSPGVAPAPPAATAPQQPVTPTAAQPAAPVPTAPAQ